MGCFRFVLALIVLVAHTEFQPEGFEPGVSAVVPFLILSGYVMAKLVGRHYPTLDRAPLFYLDRLGRIFPQYLFCLGLTIVLVAQHRIAFGFVQSCDAFQALLNVAVLPLNLSALTHLDCLYLPQAWSLALELSFYLIVPFLALAPRVALALAALSLGLYVAAVTGFADAEIFGSRLLPGTVFMFIAGMALAHGGRAAWPCAVAIWIVAAGMLAWLIQRAGLGAANIDKDVLIGLVAGLPAVAMVMRMGTSRLDQLLGNLSYGVFLNHLLCMNVLEQVVGLRIDSPARLMLLAEISALFAYATFHLIEKPVLALRRNLRAGGARMPVPMVLTSTE